MLNDGFFNSYDEGHYAVCPNANCHYGDCQFAKCRSTIATRLISIFTAKTIFKCILCNYAECRYAERHNTECRYTECRGAVLV
jgi:hypothetical protein